MLFVKMME